MGPKTAHEFQAAVAVHYPRLRVYLSQFVHEPAAVEEMLQEVFLRFVERMMKGETIVDQWSFIKSIALNVFREHLRAEARRRNTAPLGPRAESLQAPMDTQMAERETAAVIRHLVGCLDPLDRYIVMGRYFLDLTLRELAHDTGLTEGAILYRHARGLRQLRSLALQKGLSV